MYDGYGIIESIYHSQSTEVHRAIRKADDTPVILKVVSGLAPADRETRLFQEYELGITLQGERSVEYKAREQMGQKSFLVLRDDQMNSLKSVIPEDGFGLHPFFILAIEIVLAVEEIHGEGVIHKDINPSNIIVNSTLDAVKLIDFGMATRVSEEMVSFASSTDLQGTLAYISPEQTGRINKPVDSRSDLYALGITLYRMITGVLPFKASDPGELIYSHIARIPVIVANVGKDIPPPVSRVIEKLLKKSPEERYQTAAGVKGDLLFIQEILARGGEIADFKPGQSEHGKRIVLSGRLYSRKNETAKLLDCFNRSGKTGQVVAVTGRAGIGKTALIRELYTSITTRNGFFLSGKFDQLNKGLAYTALADALKDFVGQCSGQDQTMVEIWRNAIRSSVGDFGQVLTSIAPEFENLIGVQPNIAAVSPLETIARLNSVFSNLVKDICAVGHQLVMFMDDLQWADTATLSLLETIIKVNPTHLLVILSYRDDEISPAHPAKLFLDNVHKSGIEFSNICLDNLHTSAVTDWMQDILPDAGEIVEELAVQVRAKTEGNPFYITTLLHLIIEKKHIKYEADGTLRLDLDAIARLPADADVVEHLLGKIKSLEPKDAEFLTRVSVLGNRFSLDTVNLFLGEKSSRLQDSIQNLVGAHLLIKSGDEILFAHDRVQQAALALLDEAKTLGLHLEIGRNIRRALDVQAADERIEEYLHHFNAACDLVTDADQRLELARLNAVLGRRLKSNAAYQAAENSLAQAIAFLPPKPFETQYDLAVDTYTEYGETLFLNLKHGEAEQQFNSVIAHSNSPLDSARIYRKQIDHHAARGNIVKAMEIALYALEILGVKLPKRLLKVALAVDLLRVKSLLKNSGPDQVLDFPVTDDPLVLAQMDVLSAAASTAYIGYPDYFPILVLKMMRISITKGNCGISSYSYATYGMVLLNLGDVDNGYSYGKAALALMEKLDARPLFTKVSFLFGWFVNHWKAPARSSERFLENALAKGLETGDYEFASFAASKIMHVFFYGGRNINSMLDQFPDQHKILAAFGKDRAILEAKYWHQMLITLNDPDGDGVSVSGDIIDESWLIALLEERQILTYVGVCMLGKMQLAYLAGDYKTANGVRGRTIELLKAMTGALYTVVCHFFAALTCIGYYREHGKAVSLLRDAKKSLLKLKNWGGSAPDNYLYKAQLVEAELLSIEGKQTAALRLYETAIKNAQKARNNLDLGIACECMGRYLLKLGLDSLGRVKIRESIDVFRNWGAFNKSTRLGREFDMAFGEDIVRAASGEPDYSSRASNVMLDLEALSGTIKSLTSDLRFDSLLATLLDAVVRNSGATRVVYLHADQGMLRVGAEKGGGGDVEILDGKSTSPAAFGLPVLLLDDCYRGSADYVLRNIVNEKKSWGGAERTSRIKSVLIIPLMRQQQVKGLVYLENDLMEDAFRMDQVQFLSLLSGQAAIAIENALIFEKLNAERYYSTNIIQSAPILICGLGGDEITKFVNPVVEKITGYTQGELIGRNWWKLFYPGEEYRQVDRLYQKFAQGEVVDYEMCLTCKNGDKRDIVWNSFTKRDLHGNIKEIIRFGNDITEQKKAENALRKSEDRYRMLAENATDVIWTMDMDFSLTYISPSILQLRGYTVEEVMVQSLDAMMSQDSLDEVMGLLSRNLEMVQSGLSEGWAPTAFEVEQPCKDGTMIWTLNNAKFIRDSENQPLGIIGVTHNINLRKQAEDELKKARNYIANIIDSMPSVLVGVDPDGLVTQWNAEAQRITGVSVEDAAGQSLAQSFPRMSFVMEQVRKAMQLREVHSDTRRAFSEDGEIRYEDVTVYPLVANGMEGAVIRVDDVTDQVRLEEMMIQNEKMMSVGGLAAGMAHEINNPLGVILQGAQNLERRLLPHLLGNIKAAEKFDLDLNNLQKYLKERHISAFIDGIKTSGQRAAKIIRDMLQFSRKSESQMGPVDVRDMIENALELAGQDYNLKEEYDFRSIEIEREFEPSLGTICCTKTEIEQVLLNLLRNSAQVMTEHKSKAHSKITLRTSIDGEWAKIEVEDNGPGMDETTRKRVFEPFYTTKPVGKGTGLGLSVSYMIIANSHKGTMEVESELGQGTRFAIRLPLVRDDHPVPAPGNG